MKMQTLPTLLILFGAFACQEPAEKDPTPEASASTPAAVLPPLAPLPAALPPASLPVPQTRIDSLVDTNRKFRKIPATGNTVLREDIPVFARQYMGVPYVYAMSDPEKGFDCSGFIYYVYQHFKIPVPRSSINFKTYGREIPLAQAQVADLILFTGVEDSDRIGHIGIILRATGDDADFIHASSGKDMAVTISSLSAPHYRKRFVKVVDVISK